MLGGERSVAYLWLGTAFDERQPWWNGVALTLSHLRKRYSCGGWPPSAAMYEELRNSPRDGGFVLRAWHMLVCCLDYNALAMCTANALPRVPDVGGMLCLQKVVLCRAVLSGLCNFVVY